jgi:hypothetical protein
MEAVTNQQHTTFRGVTMTTETSTPFSTWASAEIERLEARNAELSRTSASASA